MSSSAAIEKFGAVVGFDILGFEASGFGVPCLGLFETMRRQTATMYEPTVVQ